MKIIYFIEIKRIFYCDCGSGSVYDLAENFSINFSIRLHKKKSPERRTVVIHLYIL